MTNRPDRAQKAVAPVPSAAALDRLSAVLAQFRVHARLFHSGPLCGVSQFDVVAGRGFLHVLRAGRMVLRHAAGSGVPRRQVLQEPTLLFYPRPFEHRFQSEAAEGADFVCATLDFEGGVQHPLVHGLPSVVVLPLAAVDGLEQTLALLFAETERVRCGQRLLADRLFDVLLVQLLRWLLDHPQQAALAPGLLLGLADARIARTLVALHERPGDGWSLATMAREAGMSRSGFAASFRTLVGTTPADYLARWRVALAGRMLRQGRSVKQAADGLGYASASSLSRAFAQQTGQSPRSWLQSVPE